VGATLRQPPNLGFPHQRGWPLLAIAISVLVNLVVFFGPIESRPPVLPQDESPIVLLPRVPRDQGVLSEMVYRIPAPASGKQASRASRPGGVMPRRERPGAASPELLQPQLTPPTPVDTGSAAPRRRLGYARVAPEYGNGLLWVRPVPVSPADIARALPRDHFALVDSATTAIMQAFLDSIASEPGADRMTLPSWTANISGKKFGIDSRFIYIAGLKIPAALLALLPLPQGGVDQSKLLNHLMDYRADIQQAARRADNLDEFKRAIREIRERKQREHDFQRAQRELPPRDSTTP
jgi:hypothetical protein